MSASFLQKPASFDADAIRSEFPILQRQVNEQPLVYLDSAASAQKPLCVINAMRDVMQNSYANVHRGLHTLANETTDAIEKSRQSIARFLNAKSAQEIVLTSGTTAAINLLASSFGLGLKKGDEIILSEMEHHSNIVPWHLLRERKGIVLRWVQVTDAGELDMEHFASLFGRRTRLVALTHMSNLLGTITDAKTIVQIAHDKDVPVLLDGSQAAVHLPVDVQQLDVDFYAITGHKLYGPSGIGALFGKMERLQKLAPWQGGGEMIESVSLEHVSYAEPPYRFEAGTPPIVEAIGLGAALDWLMSQDRTAIAEHETSLMRHIQDALRTQNDVRILGQSPGKGAVISFEINAMHAHDIAQLLDKYGVAIRAGNHCAEPLMRRFACTSSCRVSLAAYNTLEDANIFLESLDKVRSFLE
ncbi:Cysteine desulfurase =_ SufS [hydrothermal vent metagenome]|uniref:cysteine desulfurase n=1 Tax=hydrothermal vent metagenome TaxID=652676 RepID=A0A3B0S5J8_9ZZZZ